MPPPRRIYSDRKGFLLRGVPVLALELFKGESKLVLGAQQGLSRSRREAGSCILLKRVGPGAPVGEEDGKADSLEELGKDVEADGLEGLLLGEDLSEELETMLAPARKI
jgi:hypothetical protein